MTMQKRSRLGVVGVAAVSLLLCALPLLGACTKEVVKEVPVEKVVEKEVIKEVPVEKVVEKEVIKEVPVERVVEVPVLWPKVLAIGGAKENTTYYSMAVALGRIMEKYLPTNGQGQVTGGSLSNIIAIKDGKLDMGIITSDDFYKSTRGLGDYEKFGKLPIRIITMGGGWPMRLVTRADIGIQTVPDMKGKTIEVSTPGSIVSWEGFRLIFKAYGMDLDKDSNAIPRASPASSVQHIKEKKCDVTGMPGTTPHPLMMEAATLFPLYYVPVDKDKIDQIQKEVSYWSYVEIPAGIEQQKNVGPVPALGMGFGLGCSADFDASLVYAIVKNQNEHVEEAGELFQSAAEFSLKNFANGATAPFHAGAIRYYVEKGVWTPELDSLNKRLLSEAGATR